MEAAGFALEDYEEEPFGVWPENWPTFEVFARMQTQWLRAGMAGVAVGLNYCAVYPLLDKMALPTDEWFIALDDIRAMEGAALDAMRPAPAST